MLHRWLCRNWQMKNVQLAVYTEFVNNIKVLFSSVVFQ